MAGEATERVYGAIVQQEPIICKHVPGGPQEGHSLPENPHSTHDFWANPDRVWLDTPSGQMPQQLDVECIPYEGTIGNGPPYPSIYSSFCSSATFIGFPSIFFSLSRRTIVGVA